MAGKTVKYDKEGNYSIEDPDAALREMELQNELKASKTAEVKPKETKKEHKSLSKAEKLKSLNLGESLTEQKKGEEPSGVSFAFAGIKELLEVAGVDEYMVAGCIRKNLGSLVCNAASRFDIAQDLYVYGVLQDTQHKYVMHLANISADNHAVVMYSYDDNVLEDCQAQVNDAGIICVGSVMLCSLKVKLNPNPAKYIL